MPKKKDIPHCPVAQLIRNVTDKAYGGKRAAPVSKYHALLATLKPGQRTACEVAAFGKVKGALSQWLEHQGRLAATTRAKLHCADGQGGAWWFAAPAPPATHWQPAHNPRGASLF